MRVVILLTSLALVLPILMGCSKYTWHTLAPESLEELSVDPDVAPRDRGRSSAKAYVDCSPREGYPWELEGGRHRACKSLWVNRRTPLRIYTAYREPLVLQPFSFAVDDDGVYRVLHMHDDTYHLREILSRDEIVAVRVRQDHERRVKSVARLGSFALGVGVVLSVVYAFIRW